MRWPYVRPVRAAIASWHSPRGLPFALDMWASRMTNFWVCLKRSAAHQVANKLPSSLASVKTARLEEDAARGPLSQHNRPLSYHKQHLIGLCPAASVAVAFIGLRCADEVSRTLTSYLSVDCSGSVDIHFHRQQNDQLGIGHAAIIPTFPSWGGACPTKILQTWRDAGAKLTK